MKLDPGKTIFRLKNNKNPNFSTIWYFLQCLSIAQVFSMIHSFFLLFYINKVLHNRCLKCTFKFKFNDKMFTSKHEGF